MKAFFTLVVTAGVIGLFYILIPVSVDYSAEHTRVFGCSNYSIPGFALQQTKMSLDTFEEETMTTIFDKKFLPVKHNALAPIPRSYECTLLVNPDIEQAKKETTYGLYVFARTWWGAIKSANKHIDSDEITSGQKN